MAANSIKLKIIKDLANIIEYHLIPSDILTELTSRGVEFCDDTDSHIRSLDLLGKHTEACRRLLEAFRTQKEDNWFQAFVDALEAKNYQYLVELLKGETSKPENPKWFKRIIQIFTPKIEKEIKVGNIMAYLIEEELIIEEHREHVNSVKQNKGETEAVCVLLALVCRQRSNWFDGFMKVLWRCDYKHLVKDIIGKENVPSFVEAYFDGTTTSFKESLQNFENDVTERSARRNVQQLNDLELYSSESEENTVAKGTVDVQAPLHQDGGDVHTMEDDSTQLKQPMEGPIEAPKRRPESRGSGEAEGRNSDQGARSKAMKTVVVADGGDTGNVELYSYQKELARHAMTGGNSIICAPTGSGKTLTSAYVCRHLYDKRETKPFRCLFIVPIRTLVTQQADEFRKIFADNLAIVRTLSNDETLKDAVASTKDIVLFLTAQILVNSVKEGEVTIRDFHFIIMDECHHTTLDHPFHQIMRSYLKEKDATPSGLPQILGMTASLGVGKGKPLDHYTTLCANLDCHQISHVRENQEELLANNPKPKEDQIVSVDAQESDIFRALIESLMQGIEESEPMDQTTPPMKGTQAYESFVVEKRNGAEQFKGMGDLVSACQFLRVLNDTLFILDDFRAKDAMKYMNEKMVVDGLPTIYENSVLDSYEKMTSRLIGLVGNDQNPMLEKLISILETLLTKDGAGSDPKGLLLTRRRIGVEYLLDFIKTSHLNCKVDYLTGQAKSEGMTDTRQSEVIRRFRIKGDINLLIATDVAQEGLDIPRCNFVVRYNFVSNEIGAIQSKGRARARESECYLVVKRGSINERREFENLVKEHKMMETLLKIDREDPRELKQKILDVQKEDLEKLNRANQTRAAMVVPGDVIKIVCKKCKTFLFTADTLRMKGSHYICIDEDFPLTAVKEQAYGLATQNKFTYKDDIHIGITICTGQNSDGTDCEVPIGKILKYKNSGRSLGYLIAKDKIMYQDKKLSERDEYQQISKWNSTNLPFVVQTEPLSA